MKIKIRLFATLREGRAKEQERNVPDGATAREVLHGLSIAEPDVAILLVNGRDGVFDGALADGDLVSVFPPVGGG